MPRLAQQLLGKVVCHCMRDKKLICMGESSLKPLPNIHCIERWSRHIVEGMRKQIISLSFCSHIACQAGQRNVKLQDLLLLLCDAAFVSKSER